MFKMKSYVNLLESKWKKCIHSVVHCLPIELALKNTSSRAKALSRGKKKRLLWIQRILHCISIGIFCSSCTKQNVLNEKWIWCLAFSIVVWHKRRLVITEPFFSRGASAWKLLVLVLVLCVRTRTIKIHDFSFNLCIGWTGDSARAFRMQCVAVAACVCFFLLLSFVFFLLKPLPSSSPSSSSSSCTLLCL